MLIIKYTHIVIITHYEYSITWVFTWLHDKSMNAISSHNPFKPIWSGSWMQLDITHLRWKNISYLARLKIQHIPEPT